MPQLLLYVTEEQLSKIENEAHANKMSLSKWVVTEIMEKIERQYPSGWETLFGSIRNDSFYRQKQPRLEKREELLCRHEHVHLFFELDYGKII